MKVFCYRDWRYFEAVIEKTKITCQNSRISDIDHFVIDNKMVSIGSGAKRKQKDYKLSRYACYLIAQNTRVKNYDKFHNYGYKGLYKGRHIR